MKTKHLSLLLVCAFSIPAFTAGQMITGVWKGKINKQKAEVKIILHGDSLTGTSYYYESANNYRRYSIKGYFDATTNEAVWWDDQLLEEKSGRFNITTPGKVPLLSRADFNCPGDGSMMLDGKTGKLEEEDPRADLHLDKAETGSFKDEWDFVIDNFLTGTNDPDLIDSIGSIAYQKPVVPVEEKTMAAPPVIKERPIEKKETPKPALPIVTKEEKPVLAVAPPLTIEEKFTNRQKTFVAEIPVSGDSIELRFYDNAEIDGDSISLFLNNKVIFQHIRLLGSAYTIKLGISDLQDSNELIMVAENLGSIPPNTSFMIAESGGKRYEAILASTEGSSAMIRLKKVKVQNKQEVK